MVQSAVSAAITALEKDLGVVLLERNARRVQLTEAGEALLPEAQAVLDAALAARDAVEGLSRGLRGTVRVGMLSDLGLMDLPGLARDCRDRHPGVELQLRDATAGSEGMLSALSGYDVDVAFAGSSGPLPNEYAGRTLLRVPQLLAQRRRAAPPPPHRRGSGAPPACRRALDRTAWRGTPVLTARPGRLAAGTELSTPAGALPSGLRIGAIARDHAGMYLSNQVTSRAR